MLHFCSRLLIHDLTGPGSAFCLIRRDGIVELSHDGSLRNTSYIAVRQECVLFTAWAGRSGDPMLTSRELASRSCRVAGIKLELAGKRRGAAGQVLLLTYTEPPLQTISDSAQMRLSNALSAPAIRH
jgi:hypothetical protein